MTNDISVEQQIAELENEIQQSEEYLIPVMQEKVKIDKEILNLQGKVKDLVLAERMGRSNLRKKQSQLRVLTAQFWRQRRG